MRILVAPDSFKGSLSAHEVANSIKVGILNACKEAEVYTLPMTDGGEGTVQTLIEATNGKIIYKTVTGPLGNPVEAYYGLLGNENTAVIEMAAASGLLLVPPGKANPLKATSYGTGELIKAILDERVDEIIIGLGGSATMDVGIGMMQALGVSFKDINDREVGYGGEQLASIKKIDVSKLDKRLKTVKIIVASDVTNPLYGPNGAAYYYGPQKGATSDDVKFLDTCFRYFANMIKTELGQEVDRMEGGGAAGGLGVALKVFLNANIKSGIELVLDVTGIDEYLQKVDLVITGEGKIDKQTLMGKAPIGVARRAKKRNLPVVALAGYLDADSQKILNAGIDVIFGITQRPVTQEEAFRNAAKWIERTAEQIINLINLSNLA
ncbi:MAG: glycerate kinase [Halanaerobiaceae bacterium]